MSVIIAQQTWGGRRANATDTNAEYEQVWRVETDDAQDEMATILAFPDLPQLFDVYQDANGVLDSEAFLQRYEVTVDQDDPFTWIVRCFYTTDVTVSPWTAPPDIQIGTEKFVRYDVYVSKDIIARDAQNNPIYAPIVNKAGEMFDPPPGVDDSRPTLTVSVFRLFFDINTVLEYKDAVNDGTFYGQAAGKWKVDTITAQTEQHGALSIWKVTYTFHFRDEGWALLLLNMGFRERVQDRSGNFVLRAIIDSTGHPVASPYPLDNNGRKITLSNTTPLNQQILTLGFTIYNSKNFANLGLGL